MKAEAGTAHVGVDNYDSLAELGEHRPQVLGDKAFTQAGAGAGDQQ